MKWSMCERQPDAIVSDGEHVGECAGRRGGGPEAQRANEMAYYGGHFVCESVNPTFRPLILAAPAMLEALREIHVDGCCPRCRNVSSEEPCPLLAQAEPEPQPVAPEPIVAPAHEPSPEREP